MRFIHTADWHLGKSLKSQSLIDDQRYILNTFLEIVDANKADAIVIAGDIYDRSVPPEEAVNLFDQILNELILERGLHVLCIAGNHDSEGRLNFGNKLFDNAKFHIRAKLTDNIEPVVLNDDFGEVYFSLIPYFEPSKVKVALNIDDDSELTFDEAAALLVKSARSKIPFGARSVAVTHAFIVGGVESGSERRLPGGAGRVSPYHFNDYNYTALGHLHGATLTDKKVRYSGSLLKYSFDEWKQSKSVTLVDIDGEGRVTINNDLPLIPLRDVRVIKGKVNDILDNEPDSDDYISVQYEGIIFNKQNTQLRKKFTNLLEVKPIDRVLSRAVEGARQLENISNIDLFCKFFKDTTNETMTNQELSIMTELIEEMERGD
ncbi:MAG: exonuclease SbcCD subunit D [Selenomonadaceae bacterium]|nr:exonuclease SbcCD subunit D [Selenomonadaceae bacterium]